MRTSFLVLATAAATLFGSTTALPTEKRNFGTAGFISSPPDSATPDGAAVYKPGSVLPFKFEKGATNAGGVTTYTTEYLKVILSATDADGSHTNHTLANYLTSANTSSTIAADFHVPNFPKLSPAYHQDVNGRVIVEETSLGGYVSEHVSRFEL
ncbi:hypothetical protein OIV83_001846 [Microbotryomycetes sp. JL201]|nr:hypothetical protein OIV83_001846 [Microbotryomycetes sp. JL201]